MRKLIQNIASLWRSTLGGLKKTDTGNLSTKRSTLFVDNHFGLKIRIFLRDLRHVMEGSSSSLHPLMAPPSCVHGMTDLQREKFVKSIKVPGIKVPKRQINERRKSFKPLLLKLKGISAIGELANDDPLKSTHYWVLFDPRKVENEALSDDVEQMLSDFNFDPKERYELVISYENWSIADIFKAILPEESEGLSSYTQIGHIVHLNLKPENMPFKNVIGQVLLDKISSAKTVINKLNTIDNTYRNFEMELLAGENNFVTQTKENNCVFELDFSKVYWNSRLSTEHLRIVDAVEQGSTVFDVFAGVGPFAVPLAKKKECTVLANDLNPHSFQSLERNIVLNKIKTGHISTHNLDGSEFIKTVVKSNILKKLNDAKSKVFTQIDKEQHKDCGNLVSESSAKHYSKASAVGQELNSQKSYVVMNLPALAVDFLDSFDSLLSDLPENLSVSEETMNKILPVVFCYAFCSKSGNIEEEVKDRAQKVLKRPLPPNTSVRIVRNVSPNKEMVCLSFKLWSELVLGSNIQSQGNGLASNNFTSTYEGEPMTKIQKLSP